MIISNILLVGEKAEKLFSEVQKRYRVSCFKASSFKNQEESMPKCDLTLVLEQNYVSLSWLKDEHVCMAREDNVFENLDRQFEIPELEGMNIKTRFVAMLCLMFEANLEFRSNSFYERIEPYMRKKMPAKPTMYSNFQKYQKAGFLLSLHKGRWKRSDLTEKMIKELALERQKLLDLGIYIHREKPEPQQEPKKQKKKTIKVEPDLPPVDPVDKCPYVTKEDLKELLFEHTEYVETLFQEQNNLMKSLLNMADFLKRCTPDKLEKCLKIMDLMD